MSYAYDAAGTVTEEGVKHYTNSGTLVEDKGYSFFYDKAYRLTKYYEGVPTAGLGDDPPTTYVDKLEYTFDANGNRATVVTTPYGQSAQTSIYTVSDANDIEVVDHGSSTDEYDYDAAGNRVAIVPVEDWEYDYQNKLVAIRKDNDNFTEISTTPWAGGWRRAGLGTRETTSSRASSGSTTLAGT